MDLKQSPVLSNDVLPTEEKLAMLEAYARMDFDNGEFCSLAFSDTATVSYVSGCVASYQNFEGASTQEELLRYPLNVRLLLLAPTTSEWRTFLRMNFSRLTSFERLLYELAAYQRRSYLESFMSAEGIGWLLPQAVEEQVVLELVSESRRDVLDQIKNYAPIRLLWRDTPLKVQLYLVAAARGIGAEDKGLLLSFLNLDDLQKQIVSDECKNLLKAYTNFAIEKASAIGTHLSSIHSTKLLYFNLYYYLQSRSESVYLLASRLTRYNFYAYLYNLPCNAMAQQFYGSALCMSHHVVEPYVEHEIQLRLTIPSTAAFGGWDGESYSFDGALFDGFNHVVASVVSHARQVQAERYNRLIVSAVSGGIQHASVSCEALGYHRFVDSSKAFVWDVLSYDEINYAAVAPAVDSHDPFGSLLLQLSGADVYNRFKKVFSQRASLEYRLWGEAVPREALYVAIFNHLLTKRLPAVNKPGGAGRRQWLTLEERARAGGVVRSRAPCLHVYATKREKDVMSCILDYIAFTKVERSQVTYTFNKLAIYNFMRPSNTIYNPSSNGLPSGQIRVSLGAVVDCKLVERKSFAAALRNVKSRVKKNVSKPAGYLNLDGQAKSSAPDNLWHANPSSANLKSRLDVISLPVNTSLNRAFNGDILLHAGKTLNASGSEDVSNYNPIANPDFSEHWPIANDLVMGSTDSFDIDDDIAALLNLDFIEERVVPHYSVNLSVERMQQYGGVTEDHQYQRLGDSGTPSFKEGVSFHNSSHFRKRGLPLSTPSSDATSHMFPAVLLLVSVAVLLPFIVQSLKLLRARSCKSY